MLSDDVTSQMWYIYEISHATFSTKTSLDKFWWTSIISASLSTVCKIYKNRDSLKLCSGPLVTKYTGIKYSLTFVTEDGRIGFLNGHSNAWMTPRASKSTRELNYFCTYSWGYGLNKTFNKPYNFVVIGCKVYRFQYMFSP